MVVGLEYTDGDEGGHFDQSEPLGEPVGDDVDVEEDHLSVIGDVTPWSRRRPTRLHWSSQLAPCARLPLTARRMKVSVPRIRVGEFQAKRGTSRHPGPECPLWTSPSRPP